MADQNHNHRTALARPARAIVPSHIKRVEEYVLAHAGQPLTVASLAAYAKVSSRTLFASFRSFRNTTPMAYLKAVRLQRVNEELRRLNRATETITNVAMRWGFSHLSHFSADYKKVFGEFPSETLRR